MSTVAYHGYANQVAHAGARLVTVETSDGEDVLRHLVYHSPDGFSWGYGGSGPADLARSIIGHYLHTDDPAPRLYQQFKFDKIATLPSDQNWTITCDEVREWYDAQEGQ